MVSPIRGQRHVIRQTIKTTLDVVALYSESLGKIHNRIQEAVDKDNLTAQDVALLISDIDDISLDALDDAGEVMTMLENHLIEFLKNADQAAKESRDLEAITKA